MSRLIKLCCALCVAVLATAPAWAESVAEPSPAAPAMPVEPQAEPSNLAAELTAAGFRLGAPAFIRVFKAESTLELWMLRGARFELFKRYPICKWSGDLGPKLHEGDKQSPEGIYFITGGDLIINARWHRAMNVGFPNSRDQAQGLTGSGILIHGKCTSIGCFALTDPLVEEVYEIVAAALEAGQPRVPVHIFPFALTREKLAGAAGEEWSDFWKELKRGHDLFLRDRLPPRTLVCAGRYAFQSRRARLVSLAGNPACTPVTRPARPVFARNSVRERAVAALPEPDACNPRERSCQLIKAAMVSRVPCPRKYGRCRNARIAAVKSVDCPLKYPRCRKRIGGVQKRAIATLRAKHKSR